MMRDVRRLGGCHVRVRRSDICSTAAWQAGHDVAKHTTNVAYLAAEDGAHSMTNGCDFLAATIEAFANDFSLLTAIKEELSGPF